MKYILSALLIAVALSGSAAVKQQDGSVMLSKEEVESLAKSYETMVEEGKRQQELIKELEKKIEAFEKGKCI
jgi:predicted ATP-binding protein involved in virulence